MDVSKALTAIANQWNGRSILFGGVQNQGGWHAWFYRYGKRNE